MPDADAPLSRSQSDAENMSLRTYVDLQLVAMGADVKARREGMAAEELTYRAQVAAEEATFRAQVAQWRSMHEHVHAELKALAEANKETGMYLWTTAQDANKTEHETIHQAVLTTRETFERMLRDALAAHANEHARAREADLLADKKLDTRLDSMNEIRQALRDAQATGVTRDQVEDKIGAIAARLDAAMENVAAQFTRIETRLTELQNARAEAQGRSTALASVIGVVAILLSLGVSVTLHFLR